MIVRGVNVYPTALEAIVREFEVGEFRIVRLRRGDLEELRVDAEASEETARALAAEMRLRLAVRIEVRAVVPGTLPRFELKARRIVDERS
jgi:phenylacetate-CoA ligase